MHPAEYRHVAGPAAPGCQPRACRLRGAMSTSEKYTCDGVLYYGLELIAFDIHTTFEDVVEGFLMTKT